MTRKLVKRKANPLNWVGFIMRIRDQKWSIYGAGVSFLKKSTSVAEVRGVMSLARYDNPEDFKRAGYAKVLNRYW